MSRLAAERLGCTTCSFFVDDPFVLEEELRGIGALSSALGSARGDAGLCVAKGVFLDPATACELFRERAREMGGDVTRR